jgi:DNA topoisomerase-1
MPIERVQADSKYGVRLAQKAWRQREPEEAANFLGEIMTPISSSKLSEHKCPKCGKPMVHKNGRFGPFLGCSDYPECKTTLKLDKEGNVLPPKPPAEPTGIKCHKCKTGELVIRQSKKGPFMGCNKFPKCRTIISIKQLDQLKQLQSEGQWPPDTIEQADEILGRTKTREKVKARK